MEAAWSSIDPSEYKASWAIDALCEHLQAVAEGQIRRLLVNFPPRCGKTNVVSICYPAWTWCRRQKTFLSGSQVRFLTGSYNDDLALENAMKHRRLILSPWYRERWGERFGLMADQNTKTKFDTSTGGTRISTSARGNLLGFGGDVILVDDPHNTKQAESEAERLTSLTWWKELRSTRLNDPKQTAIVVIMQRLHEEDVSGAILSAEDAGDWEHVCIPMEYDWRRHSVTVLGWEDPRGVDDDGESLVVIDSNGDRIARDEQALLVLENERQNMLMWEERFGPKEVEAMKVGLGPYMASGRLQQMPVPPKGGIFQRDWWQLWDPKDGKFPIFEYLLASVDSAFTANEENDPTGMTVWGIFRDDQNRKRVMLVHAWRKHLPFSGPREAMLPGESKTQHTFRTQKNWGLMEWIKHTCERFKVDKLLIEAKASGISAAQELQNRYGLLDFSVQLCKVTGDKVSRAYAVQPVFSQGLVWSPSRDWADGDQGVITEMSVFPKGRFKDLTDSTTQAIAYLRNTGLLRTDEEESHEEAERVRHRPRPKSLYPV